MPDKKFWDDVYQKGLTPWINKDKDAVFASRIIKDVDMKQSAKILDYGCGEGILGEYFLAHGMNVDFAEISSIQVDALRKKFKDKSHVYEVCEPKDISGKYDVIVCSGVMHHIDKEKWPAFLDQFQNLLNSGGKLWLSGFDKSDEIINQDQGNFYATDDKCQFIEDILEMAEKSGFEAIVNDLGDVKLGHFKKPRVMRFICLKTKQNMEKTKENAPAVQFSQSSNRVEYASQKLQDLQDKRQKSATEHIDSTALKIKEMQTALKNHGFAPEDMGKTDGENGKKIGEIQTMVYKRILETKKGKNK